MAAAPPRPPSVTMASFFLGAASVLLLANVVVLVNSWDSLEVQDGLRKALTPSVLADSGLTFDQAARWVRRLLLGTIVLLVAGVVFAVYTALGHRVSRIMLTILAVLTSMGFLVSGGIVGTIPAVLAIVCAFQLWTPEARTWFAVKNGRPVPAQRLPAPPPTQVVPPPVGPGPYAPQQQPPAGQYPYAYPPPARPSGPSRALPLTLLIGGLVVAAGSAAFLLVYGFARDELVKQELSSGANWMDLDEQEIRDGLQSLAVLSGVMLPLGVAAIVIGLVMLRRIRRH